MMNEERIQAYLNLIQQLLTCPSGEEIQILNQSLDLVDGGFVQVCEQVAQQLQEAGEENGAGFLRNLAQQVGEFLNSSGGEGGETQGNATEEEYFNFLMGLLQVEIDSNSDPKVVYPFLAQHQDKLDLTFADILQQWFHSELDPNNLERNQSLAAFLNIIAVHISEFPLGSRSNNLEIAIASFQAALSVRTRTAFPEQWATTQNNLGTAYKNRIKGERGENLENAIASYQEALEVRTRTAFPQNHAETLFNLGLAYREVSQIQNAYHTFAAAIDTVEEIRSGITLGGEAARQKLAEEWQQLYIVMVEVCLELENYAAALEYAERSKARNLVELLAATRLKPEAVSQQVWERYDRLYQQWWNLQQQCDSSASPPDNRSPNDDTRSIPVSSPTTPTPNDSQNLTQLRQQIDHFIATEITPHDPKFRFGQQVQPIRYGEIQALVNAQTALIEWYFTYKGIHAFIVTHQGEQPIVVSTDSNAVDALEQLKDEYLTNYLNRDNHWREELPSYLQRLAEILELNHLISQIPSQYQQLILIPYRALHLFPLHALPLESPPAPLNKGGEEIKYLSDRFPQGIRYAPSSQILQLSLTEDTTPPEQEAARNSDLAPRGRASIFRSQVEPGNDVGGSSFSPPYEGGAGGGSLFAIQNPTADLTYTDIEVEAIQTAFNPATVLPGKAANKTGFNQAVTQLKETTFAHFSCHGYFNFANPRISGLILADAKLSETAATEKGIPVIRSRRGEFNPDECLTKQFSDTSTNDTYLDDFKTQLKNLAKESLSYTRLLRKMEDFGNTIEINIYNYNEKIAQICDKLEIDKEELSFLKYFGEETAPLFRRQIQADLGYFEHGTDLIAQAIASIRGIVEIDQAERDRQREKANQDLQDQIQTVGVGIAVGAIFASTSGLITQPWALPSRDRLFLPPHPFIFALVLSLLFAWVAFWVAEKRIKRKRYR